MVSGSAAATIRQGWSAGGRTGLRSVASILGFAGSLPSRNQPGQHGMRHADHRLGEFPGSLVPLHRFPARTLLSGGPVLDVFLLSESGRGGGRFVFGLAGAE